MKKLFFIMMIMLCQQSIANDIAKTNRPDIYMITPKVELRSFVGDSYGKEKLDLSNANVQAIKLDASALTSIQATIKEISNSVCAASDKVTKYTFTINTSLNAVIIGGESGIAVEVQCQQN